MIIYEITARVRLDLIDEFEKYMNNTHISDLFNTGYFENAEFTRVTDGVYRIQYYAKDRGTLDEYINKKAKSFREEFNAKFPDGIELNRSILEVLQFWNKD